MTAERNETKDSAHLDLIENHSQKTFVNNTNLGADSASSFIDDTYSEKVGGTNVLYEEKTSVAAWVEILVCMGVSTSCAFMWTTCAGVPNIMSKWMEVSLTQINWLSNASSICNTSFSLLTAWAYEKFGIKTSVSDYFFFFCIYIYQNLEMNLHVNYTSDHCLRCSEYSWMLDKMYLYISAFRKKILDSHVGPVHCKHRRSIDLQVSESYLLPSKLHVFTIYYLV